MGTESGRVEHTPGPWEPRQYGSGTWSVHQIHDHGHCEVCRVEIASESHDPAEDEANARLIAAAPTLLKACKALDFFWCEDGDCPDSNVGDFSEETLAVWRQIRSAIALVEGGAA